MEDIWRQAGSGPTPVSNNPTTARLPSTAAAVVGNPGVQTSFHQLPSHLRNNNKYAWANPSVSLPNLPPYAGPHSHVDLYSPSYKSADPSQPRSSVQTVAKGDAYRPESVPTPSLTNNYYSSSASKTSSYGGTARPNSTRTPWDAVHLAQTIPHELGPRHSSELKKPGILKRSNNRGNPGADAGGRTGAGDRIEDRIGDRTPGSMVDPARKAMFAEPDIEMNEVAEIRGARPTARRADREDLLFNRSEQQRQGTGGDAQRGWMGGSV